jgi:hypothetical protein
MWLLILQKATTPAEFAEVAAAKVAGAMHLDELLDPDTAGQGTSRSDRVDEFSAPTGVDSAEPAGGRLD